MVAIRIEERAQNEFNAVVSFDGSGEYPAKIADPFSPEEEARLEWYFEEHLRFPFTDQVKARDAGESIKAYGERLFSQVFADRDAFAEYKTAARQGLGQLRLEIVGSPEFHCLHWEALKDLDLPKPLCLYAPMVRRGRKPQVHPAGMVPSPTINLLIVTARPHVERDVGYRTITRPLVEALRATRLPVDIDIVRPGTYRALSEHLKNKGVGFYHVVHFDLHGALLSHEEFLKAGQAEQWQFGFGARYDSPDLPAYAGEKAFLFFEDESAPHGDDTERRADPAEASEVAERLLLPYRIPIVILNACQSGKQTGDTETSLAARLMEAGVQTVLGMAYSVTVSAAKAMMPKLYGALSEGEPLDRAILAARGELEAIKSRRAYYDQQIALEDWLLPVVYQHKPTPLVLSEFTPPQREAWLREKQAQYRPRQPTYGFFGRDVDILRIEKRLLGADGGNILLVRGMGGAGKSTLLHHLGAWWQQTGLVERVFYFGWDEKAWTRQQILHAIAGTLYDPGRFHGSFLPLGEDLQQEDVAEALRGSRHLLILDNLESITGSPLSVPNALSPAEQGKLREFLSRLGDGRMLVLLGSRGGEEWLSEGTFGVNVHTLQGLDAEAASDLAERVLARHGATARRTEPKFRELMTLLAGYPLALEVVLTNLKARPPADVLAALEEGAAGLDAGGADKTENILRCIEYSHGNLSAEAQGLLACLAPFTGVISQPLLDTYAEQLRAQPPLAHLPFEHWQAVLKEATDWGLLTADPDVPGVLRIQPVLPYFLRQHLSEPARAAERDAIETAFRQHYDGEAGAVSQLLNSKNAQERRRGRFFADREYANLTTALRLALRQQVSILNPYVVLSGYLDVVHAEQLGLELADMVIDGLNAWPQEKLTGSLALQLGSAIDDAARRYLNLKRYPEAEAAYKRALQMVERAAEADPVLRNLSGRILHQRGMVAAEQRRWAEAEQYYQQALAIFVEFNARYEQASTYHQLGAVAQHRGDLAAAEDWYKNSLEIREALDDRLGMASTYHQLGIVAQHRGKLKAAEGWYRRSLEINEVLDDRLGMASTYHQLGTVAQQRSDLTEAEAWYRKALEIEEALDDRQGLASTYHQLGGLAKRRGRSDEARTWYEQALSIRQEMDSPIELSDIYVQLADLLSSERDGQTSARFLVEALRIYGEQGQTGPTSDATLRRIVAHIASASTDSEAAKYAYEVMAKIENCPEARVADWVIPTARAVESGLLARTTSSSSGQAGEQPDENGAAHDIGVGEASGSAYDIVMAIAWRVVADSLRRARLLQARKTTAAARQEPNEVHAYTCATEYMHRAAEIHFVNDESLSGVRFRLEAIRCLERSGAWTRALAESERLHQQIRTLVESTRVPEPDGWRIKAELFVDMAALMRQFGDYERAANRLKDAQRAYRRVQDTVGEGKALLEEAILNVQQGLTDDAKRALVDAEIRLGHLSEFREHLKMLREVIQADSADLTQYPM